jgi:hypothetical protein
MRGEVIEVDVIFPQTEPPTPRRSSNPSRQGDTLTRSGVIVVDVIKPASPTPVHDSPIDGSQPPGRS